MIKLSQFTMLLLVASSVLAQSTTSENAPVITADSTLVTVPALVRSESGELVTNLTSRDFRLTDNGAEQRLLADAAERQPLALVVLMQTGGAAPFQFQNYRTFSLLFTAMLGSESHKVALVTFDSRLRQIWNFPPRFDGIKHAFKKPESGDRGAAILDALNCGIALLEQQPKSRRRLILLLSQPGDEGSVTPAEDVVRRLGKSNTTVYSVSFPPANGPSHIKRKNRDSGALGSLDVIAQAIRNDTAVEAAILTGGESVPLKSKDDLDRTLSILATDFANTFLLSFRPNTSEPGLHTLQTEIPKRGGHLTVKARAIYWADPSAADPQ